MVFESSRLTKTCSSTLITLAECLFTVSVFISHTPVRASAGVQYCCDSRFGMRRRQPACEAEELPQLDVIQRAFWWRAPGSMQTLQISRAVQHSSRSYPKGRQPSEV